MQGAVKTVIMMSTSSQDKSNEEGKSIFGELYEVLRNLYKIPEESESRGGCHLLSQASEWRGRSV